MLKGLRQDRNLPSVVRDDDDETNVQFIDLEREKERSETFHENHRKCDNKNKIYEPRLVIYLCANLLLQSEGRMRHYYVTSGERRKF